jgi:hypothetical protein
VATVGGTFRPRLLSDLGDLPVATVSERSSRSALLLRLRRRVGRTSLVRMLRGNGRASEGRDTPATASPPAKRRRPEDDPRFRPDSPAALQDAWRFLRSQQARERHVEVEARVRARLRNGAPLRVVFAVNERSKWNADGLVAAMQEREWEVTVALFRMERKGEEIDDARREYGEERAFFRSLPTEFVDTYDWETRTERPIETLEADVVFLQQPWRMESFPARLVGRALPAYLPYSVPLLANVGMHLHIPGFHAYLWRRYLPTEVHMDLHLREDPHVFDQLRVVGYPRFDGYHDPALPPAAVDGWRHEGEPAARVIVAPHHSVGPTSLGIATFPWSHRPLLDLVDSYPEVSWLYKPHPRLRHALAQAGIMDGAAYDAYEREWVERPNAAIYDGPRYLDLFRTSDAMITDSGSFLAEYLPTGKPIIRLTSPHGIGFNPIGELLRSGFYELSEPSELASTFERVVLRGDDPLSFRREELVRLFVPDRRLAAERIVTDLAQLEPEVDAS